MQIRRFFQVSIRTLLILTTLVAIGMAFWTQIYQRVREQKTATAKILALGGKVRTERSRRLWPQIQRAIGEEYFQEVVEVDLDGALVVDHDLAPISKLRSLKFLSLAGLAPRTCRSTLPPPNNPKFLPSQITDRGLRQFGLLPRLESLELRYTSISDEGLQTIAAWDQLQKLDLHRTKVTSQGMGVLENLKHLKELSLGETMVDDSAVATLSHLSSLKKLRVYDTGISGNGMLQLREALPHCEILGPDLDLSAAVDPDPQSMRWKEVTRHAWVLSRAGELKLLILAGTAISDSHLKDLDRLEKTDVIDLRRTKVTAEGIAMLQRALPSCKIECD